MKEMDIFLTLKTCEAGERAGSLELNKSVFKVWSTLSVGMSVHFTSCVSTESVSSFNMRITVLT